MASQVRQNYHSESEAGVNKQINLELYASYVYQSMVSCRPFSLLLVRRLHYTDNVQFHSKVTSLRSLVHHLQ